MEDLKALLLPLLVIFVICAVILSISALRNKVLFKMGARNVPRRLANTVLTVLGLMLAAMIFSASFATGDTLTHSIRNLSVEFLGEVDIMVMKKGADFNALQGHLLETSETSRYFDQTELENINSTLTELIENGTIDGIAPAIIETVPVVAEATDLNEPVVTLLAFDYRHMDAFDPLLDERGKELSLKQLEDLEGNYTYINTALAEELEVGVDDEIIAYLYLGIEEILSKLGVENPPPDTNIEEFFAGLDIEAAMANLGIEQMPSEPDMEQTLLSLSLKEIPLTIAGIYETGGNPSTFSFDSSSSIVVPLSQMQSYHSPGSTEINNILITNKGDSFTGATHSEAIMSILEPSLEGTEFEVNSIKKDALDDADEGGAQFSTIFLVFGSFSIIAGILLIFLIFVMLAAERKQELGIARAVGTQRGHIIRLFTFEGILYALIASAVGAGLGLLVSWGGMELLNSAFKEMGFKIVFDFTSSGLTISYLMGVLFTLLIVVISAWRVSNLNIICAIKDIPEPPNTDEESIWSLVKRIYSFRLLWGFLPVSAWTRFKLLWGFIPIYWTSWELYTLESKLFIRLIPFEFPIFGCLLIIFGIQATQWGPYSIGVSLAIIGLCMLMRKWPFRMPDRPAFTLAGILLVVFWLSPVEWHPKGEEMGAGFEMFILTGVMLVMGSVWVVMYNSDLLLKAIMFIFGRMRSITPMIKTAVSYPMASRFRTGMAVSMFALIIFTLVYMSSMTASFRDVINDTDRVAGSFHIRANVVNPISNIETALDESGRIGADSFTAIASFNGLRVNMRDASGQIEEDPVSNESSNNDATEKEWVDLYLEGANAGYTENVTYSFETMTAEYSSKEEVWNALVENPSLAVVSTALAPTQFAQMGGAEFDLVIGEGEFVIEDDIMPDNIFVEVQNPSTLEVHKLRVIGVVDMMAGPYAGLVTTSQATLNTVSGLPVLPTSYRFQVAPENVENVPELSTTLEKQFKENGMNTEVMADEVKDYARINEMFMNLMMAFMGLGLIVGIAALGVIAARSVVERRQQIGMLRAIGFQQGMIQFSFLLESSFVALLGIGLGVGLGAITAFLFMDDAGIEGMKAVLPWTQIAMIMALAYVASLITTFLPAYRAARIYPAEALRYE